MLNIKRLMSVKTLKFVIFISLIVGLALFVRHYLSLYQQLNMLKQDPAKAQELQQKEAKKLVAEVSKIMELPQDEIPTVATVTDSTKLAKEPFFEKAKNGDKTLIYSKAGKAILYDPRTHKIIAFTSISMGNPGGSPIPTPTPAPVRVAIRNGSGLAGSGSKAEQLIVKTVPNITIGSVRDAANSDYSDSVIVVINNQSSNTADQISELVKGKVGPLPTGESAPSDTDVLIIIGSAFNK